MTLDLHPHFPFMLNVKQRSKLTIIIKHSLVEVKSLWLLEIIPSAENLDGLLISMGFPGSLLFHLMNGIEIICNKFKKIGDILNKERYTRIVGLFPNA